MMALTNEDLQNISVIFLSALAPMQSDLNILKTDMIEVKSDIRDLKTDVGNLKSDMVEVKADVAELKTDVAELKSDMVEVKADVAVLKSDMVEVKADIKSIKQTINKNYSILEEFYIFQKEFDTHIKSLLDNHDSRIFSLERIVCQNSLDICNLKEKVS
ncbi:MAG: hypothetical protein Q4C91_08630 [Eubacteriales bacterium]|nr:hypothetical protein [Eubacteriales bacterium]